MWLSQYFWDEEVALVYLGEVYAIAAVIRKGHRRMWREGQEQRNNRSWDCSDVTTSQRMSATFETGRHKTDSPFGKFEYFWDA